MGIPHLISTLEPYAVQHRLTNEDIVIDGPALAYHVLYICRCNGIGQPSYSHLGATAIRWLQHLLNSSHVSIKAIFFDGYLPMAKRTTRMERMLSYTASLHQMFSASPDGCDERKFEAQGHVDIFSSKLPDQRQFFAPTFLVPAVIEALRNDAHFQPLVQVVPGEADAFCARHLEDRGGLVFTSDSDLLVHDLGESGKVVFFRDIHMPDVESPTSCRLYDPHTISAKFGLGAHRLLRFAYELSQDSNQTVHNLVKKCFKDNLVVADWNAFLNQYLHIETIPVPTTAPERTPLALVNLDPRLSEIALQLGNNYSGDDYPRTFLPVLIESPIRGSAWELSTWIRQLAYSLLKRAVRAKSNCVLEYRKVASLEQRGKQVAMLSEAQMKSAAMDITVWMSYIRRDVAEDIDTSNLSPWLVLALKFLVSGRGQKEEEKILHAQKVIEEALVQPSQSRRISWDVIHLSAQVQAFLGSLRMLQQILSLIPQHSWLSLLPGNTLSEDFFNEMSSFLPLQNFPSIHNITSLLARLHEQPIRDILQHFINVQQVLDDAEEAAKDKAKRKKRKNTGSGGSTPKRPAKEEKINNGHGKNMFDILPDADNDE